MLKGHKMKKESQKVIEIKAQTNGRQFDKPLHSTISAIIRDSSAYDGSGLRDAITIKVYHSPRGSSFYASVWIAITDKRTGAKVYASGRGSAGGYGYCKLSAACADALASAGVKLSQSIAGVGERAVEDALRAICKHFWHARPFILRT